MCLCACTVCGHIFGPLRSVCVCVCVCVCRFECVYLMCLCVWGNQRENRVGPEHTCVHVQLLWTRSKFCVSSVSSFFSYIIFIPQGQRWSQGWNFDEVCVYLPVCVRVCVRVCVCVCVSIYNTRTVMQRGAAYWLSGVEERGLCVGRQSHTATTSHSPNLGHAHTHTHAHTDRYVSLKIILMTLRHKVFSKKHLFLFVCVCVFSRVTLFNSRWGLIGFSNYRYSHRNRDMP